MPVCLSFGELCDRLAITHVKLWHLEEKMADSSLSDEKKVEITSQIVSLNGYRSRLVSAIDECFEG